MNTKYQKPTVTAINDIAEIVYMSSGFEVKDSRCNSQYMGGNFRVPDYSNIENYLCRFGCNGCPAFRPQGCAMQLEYYWGSYDVDNGHRLPNWEKIGHNPYDPIDWNDVGMC